MSDERPVTGAARDRPGDRTPWHLSERSRDGGVDRVPLPGAPGGLALCGKHVVGPDPAAALVRAGATVVVCLVEPHELEDRYPAYTAWLRAEEGRLARWRPIPDLHAPSVEAAHAIVEELAALVEAGEVLLVHCGAGIGRAGTVAAALLLRLGLPLDDALAAVHEARPGAGPQADVQQALLEQLAGRHA